MSDDLSRVQVREYTDDRAAIEWSFRNAEDSPELLAAYRDLGMVWVAADEGRIAGHIQAVERGAREWEIQSLAVQPEMRGQGIGRRLVGHVVHEAELRGVRAIELATGAADIANLGFYQRCGFRMVRIVPDYFTAERGYPPRLEVDGIPLLDQVWFRRELAQRPVE